MTSEPTTILGQALTSGVQIAYLTNDTRRAIELFESRLGIGPWVTREVPLTLTEGPEGAAPECTLRASFAFMAGRMFEIIEPAGEALPVFPLVGEGELAVVPHHVGAFSQDADAIIEAAHAANLNYYRFTSGRGDIVFVDMRSLVGQWLEALCFPNQNPI